MMTTTIAGSIAERQERQRGLREDKGGTARPRGGKIALAGVCLALALSGLAGCTHGSDDTGGNSSAGSMSGATGPQMTQGMANRQGPPPGGGPNPAPATAP